MTTKFVSADVQKRLFLNLDPAIFAELVKLARAEERTVKQMANLLIREGLARHAPTCPTCGGVCHDG